MTHIPDDIIPYFKIKDIKTWAKKIYGEDDKTDKILDFDRAITKKQKSRTWRAMRSVGAESTRYFMENFRIGKLIDALSQTKSYNNHVVFVLTVSPAFKEYIERNI